MKARDVVGRKIVAIRQEWHDADGFSGDRELALVNMELDDGTVITFAGCEVEGDTIAVATVHKHLRRKEADAAKGGVER